MMITPQGDWVVQGSAEFLRDLGDLNPDYDAALFAVKNLGYIRFELIGDHVIEVELHPRNVALPALLAVQQQLLCSKIRLFRIKYLDLAWHSEITSSAEQAVARLSTLCSYSPEPGSTERFSAEMRSYAQLFDDEEHPLRPMLLKWRMSFGHFDPTVISFAINHQLASRMMIFGVKPHSPEPVFRFVGDGFFWTDGDFQMMAPGEKLVNQPDKEYGAWVAEFYKSVAATGEPRYDTVTATIMLPANKSGLLRTRYERLLLPWKTPSDEILVTLSSRSLSREELPAAPASAEPDRSLTRKLVKSS
jgi:hypothetical protein